MKTFQINGVTGVNTIVNARANVAMRDEDLRIATKHQIEAAERIGTEENVHAYRSAVRWEETCREARRLAGCHLRDQLKLYTVPA